MKLPRFRTGDPDLDGEIAALVNRVGTTSNEDLIFELVASALLLAKDRVDRGDLKIANAALQELRHAFLTFAPYRASRKVGIFGSARTRQDDPLYQQAARFAAAMAAHEWMVITGAGPGIMAAGHEGAGAANSFGVGIKLPIEQSANGFIAGDPKLIDFKYFFTRKIMFMKESDAFVLLPGGFGTLDEAFELLTLMQTGKTAIRPVVLLEPEGSTYWDEWLTFMRDELCGRGLASLEDMSLFELARTTEDAVALIERFYRNYHSARYVGERLVLRVRRVPSAEHLARLNRDFADLIEAGRIERIRPTPAEQRDKDALDLQRLALFPVHNFGRIRQLIDALNEL